MEKEYERGRKDIIEEQKKRRFGWGIKLDEIINVQEIVDIDVSGEFRDKIRQFVSDLLYKDKENI